VENAGTGVLICGFSAQAEWHGCKIINKVQKAKNPNYKKRNKNICLGREGTALKKGAFLLTALIFLAGCAVPLPLKVASWALDGISYIATDKSLTDHGLSMATEKDCALLRTFKGEEICVEGDAYTLIAALKEAGNQGSETDFATETADGAALQASVDSIAAFDTAAGGATETAKPAVAEQSRVTSAGNGYDASEFTDAWRYLASTTAKPPPEAAPQKPAMVTVVETARKTDTKLAARPLKWLEKMVAYQANEVTAAWAFMKSLTETPDNTETAVTVDDVTPEHLQIASLPEPAPSLNFAVPGPESTADSSEDEFMAEEADIGKESGNEGGELEGGEPPSFAVPEETFEIQDDSETAGAPIAGLYYVIGSLTHLIDPELHFDRAFRLGSQVVVARLEERDLYREVVGPFKRSEKAAIREKLEKAGVEQSWLTFIDPARWSLAKPAEVSAITGAETQTAALH